LLRDWTVAEHVRAKVQQAAPCARPVRFLNHYPKEGQRLGGPVAVHERVWEKDDGGPESQRGYTGPPRDWKPLATYVFLGIMGLTFVLQLLLPDPRLWAVANDWLSRPWSVVTSVFAHGGIGHLLINGFVLFFFGPILERIIGRKAFVLFFLLTGMVSGVIQVEFKALMTGAFSAGWGASGAISAILGVLLILMPRQQVLFYGVIPMPFWLMGLLFVGYDILRTFDPDSRIGTLAHLSGIAMGLGYGWWLKQQASKQQAGRVGWG
jgi:uncharacterized protein